MVSRVMFFLFAMLFTVSNAIAQPGDLPLKFEPLFKLVNSSTYSLFYFLMVL